MRPRKRIEVNLDELDQIIDRGQCAPLERIRRPEAESALHALPESLSGTRSTEKTSQVLPQTAAEKPATDVIDRVERVLAEN